MTRLQQAIATNGELISQTGQILESNGFLRPDSPQANGGREKNPDHGSQLAVLLSKAADLIEQNNARLSNIINRIDG